MVIETETDVAALTARLRRIDSDLAKLTAERLRVLARIDQLLNPDGQSGRVAAGAIAQASRCSPSQAAGEVALARRLAELPAVSDAFARGELSNGQIGAVAMIASPGDEQHALELAKTASPATLEREAAARRKDLFEQRQLAQVRRFVSFKPSGDKSSITMIARGPWAETSMLQQRLEKVAAQLEKGAGAAKSTFSARMYDALIILAGGVVTTLADMGAKPADEPPPSNASPRVATPRLDTRNGLPVRGGGSVGVLERDPEPFAESADESDDGHYARIFDDSDDDSDDDFDDDFDDRRYFDDPSEPFPVTNKPATNNPGVFVTRAATKIVIHYDARTGIANYQNGPPIDHPRFLALLCDASLEVIHYDRGTPNGIVTTQRTRTDRQARYLAHRDGPCRVPACPGIGHTHAHHLTPASVAPGRTETSGLINICNYHHTQHHDGNLDITGDPEGTITLTSSDGRSTESSVRKT